MKASHLFADDDADGINIASDGTQSVQKKEVKLIFKGIALFNSGGGS